MPLEIFTLSLVQVRNVDLAESLVTIAYARQSQVDTLKLGWCNIEDGDGAKALSDLLMYNQTLVTVDLRGNKLVRHSLPMRLHVYLKCCR